MFLVSLTPQEENHKHHLTSQTRALLDLCEKLNGLILLSEQEATSRHVCFHIRVALEQPHFSGIFNETLW